MLKIHCNLLKIFSYYIALSAYIYFNGAQYHLNTVLYGRLHHGVAVLSYGVDRFYKVNKGSYINAVTHVIYQRKPDLCRFELSIGVKQILFLCALQPEKIIDRKTAHKVIIGVDIHIKKADKFMC